jgi:hypothetical protein
MASKKLKKNPTNELFIIDANETVSHWLFKTPNYSVLDFVIYKCHKSVKMKEKKIDSVFFSNIRINKKKWRL